MIKSSADKFFFSCSSVRDEIITLAVVSNGTRAVVCVASVVRFCIYGGRSRCKSSCEKDGFVLFEDLSIQR